MSTVTTLRDYRIKHDVMEPHLSGDTVGYHQETVEGFAYRCDGCGSIWAKRWYAETCEKRGHKASFDQLYTYRLPGFQTHGQYGQTAYTRFRLGRDKRITQEVTS